MDNNRQNVEAFHLLFLLFLAQKIDKKFYVLKGGCNMRFYFKSPRYSEDIDIDVQTLSVDIVKEKVGGILTSAAFREALQARNIEIEHITEHKQTGTTQRWKMGLLTLQTRNPLPTKIEFSRRGVKTGMLFESIDPVILHFYGLPPILLNHYSAESTFLQKVRALISRSSPQARDVFDLYLLLASGAVSRPALNRINQADLCRAKENVLFMGYETFKSQVLSYLCPEDQKIYDSEEIWDNMRLQVIEILERSVL